MRYDKDHKEKTRSRIVEVAAEEFRRKGVKSVGVAGLMADAGLTHGGFYAHFESKEALLCEALDTAFTQVMASMAQESSGPGDGLENLLKAYLNKSHADNPAHGCPASSLTAEVARHPDPTRAAFSGNVSRFVSLIEAQLTESSDADKRQRATAIFSLMIGGIQMARAEPDEKRKDEILAAASRGASVIALESLQ